MVLGSVADRLWGRAHFCLAIGQSSLSRAAGWMSVMGVLKICDEKSEDPRLHAAVESHPNVEKHDVRMGHPALPHIFCGAKTVPSAAKAGTENRPVIAAVNRCATQRLQAAGIERLDRSGEPLRHPKAPSHRNWAAGTGLPRWQSGPQGLKPAFLLVLIGTAEAVPFPRLARIRFSVPPAAAKAGHVSGPIAVCLKAYPDTKHESFRKP